jgi:hypothetical protein
MTDGTASGEIDQSAGAEIRTTIYQRFGRGPELREGGTEHPSVRQNVASSDRKDTDIVEEIIDRGEQW